MGLVLSQGGGTNLFFVRTYLREAGGSYPGQHQKAGVERDAYAQPEPLGRSSCQSRKLIFQGLVRAMGQAVAALGAAASGLSPQNVRGSQRSVRTFRRAFEAAGAPFVHAEAPRRKRFQVGDQRAERTIERAMDHAFVPE